MNQMTVTPETVSSLPQRPRLVLRAGFAGSQRLVPEDVLALRTWPEDEQGQAEEREYRSRVEAERTLLKRVLAEVLVTLGHRLAAIAPGVPVEAGNEPRVSAFFQQQAPLLRLVTGLCEGADALAAQVLEGVNIAPDAGNFCKPGTECLEKELGAVLPFDVETYRRSRPDSFRAEFDRQLARCAWVLTLDGLYDKPTEKELAMIADDTERRQRSKLADLRRARGYRAQAAFLLRQSDLLIAAADPTVKGSAGGTLETVREAQIFDLPVVFIHTGTGEVHLVEPGDDLHSVLAMPPKSDWKEMLVRWVNQITTDPDRDLDPGDHAYDEQRRFGESLLLEYFDRADSPGSEAAKPMVRFRKWAWVRFEKCFRSGPGSNSDPKLKPYELYRSRATELNYHYSGLYRGAFLLNYAFAIMAVALATVSLALLGKIAHPVVANEISELAETGIEAAHIDSPPTSVGSLLPVLVALAVTKLSILFFIIRNTTRANKERWNDRAVDLRYLSERLRSMFYLPRLGIQQPPVAAPPQFASRVVRQSAMDWLFDSISRSVSPADLPCAAPLEIPTHDGAGMLTVKKLLTFDPCAEVELIRDSWIAEQARYHERNARTQHALNYATESVGKWLGRAVIVMVAFDIIFIVVELLDKMHMLPEVMVPWVHSLAPVIPWLVVLTALLPAIVAALGGIRFQSECQRLAERSAVMRVLLGGRVPGHHGKTPSETPFTGGRWREANELAERIAAARDQKDTDSAAWSHDALRVAERTARDFVQEVAEWSVLYAKEVAEPG
jgi:hypothetical protein